MTHNRIFGPCLTILSILNRLERWRGRRSLCTTHDLTKAPQPKASLWSVSNRLSFRAFSEPRYSQYCPPFPLYFFIRSRPHPAHERRSFTTASWLPDQWWETSTRSSPTPSRLDHVKPPTQRPRQQPCGHFPPSHCGARSAYPQRCWAGSRFADGRQQL